MPEPTAVTPPAAPGPVRLSELACGQRARLFRRDLYQGAKEMLRRRGVGEARIHETGSLIAHAAIRRKHAGLLRQLRQSKAEQMLEPAAALCAALLVETMASAPIGTEAAGDPHDGRDASLRCLAPLAIAYGVVTASPFEASDAQILEEALLVADARHDVIIRALASEQPMEQLQKIFAALLKHLP